MSVLLQGLSWGLGTARVRAALGRALARLVLVLVAGIVVLVAIGYLLEAGRLALATLVGPTYAALAMGGALLLVAVGCWLAARLLARRKVAALPISTGETGRLLLILFGVLAGFLATRARRSEKQT